MSLSKVGFVFVLLSSVWFDSAFGRSQYKKAIEGLDSPNEIEKQLQEQVKADGCKACHEKGDNKKLLPYGKKLSDLLPKFDAANWKGDALPESTKKLRDAVQKVR